MVLLLKISGFQFDTSYDIYEELFRKETVIKKTGLKLTIPEGAVPGTEPWYLHGNSVALCPILNEVVESNEQFVTSSVVFELQSKETFRKMITVRVNVHDVCCP